MCFDYGKTESQYKLANIFLSMIKVTEKDNFIQE